MKNLSSYLDRLTAVRMRPEVLQHAVDILKAVPQIQTELENPATTRMKREDIIQEGMIGLYKAIRDFKEDKQANFSAFADLCATRQIVTAIKTATRLKHTPLNNYISLNKPMYENESEKTLIDLVAETIVSDPEQIVINAESFDQISSEIFKYLSKFEKDVLHLYLDGKSYQEISEELGRTSKSIDNALQRIKKKLETQLMSPQ